MHSSTLIAHIESTARPSLAASWDKSGVQIASSATEIQTMAVALDPTEDTVRQAVEHDADFLLCHHPLTLTPKLPDRVDSFHHVLSMCLKRGMWLYSAHTSLDANPAGPVNWLGKTLGLQDMKVLEVTSRETPTLVRFRAPSAANWTERMVWPEEMNAVRAENWQAIAHELPLSAPGREFGFGCIGNLPRTMSWKEFTALLSTHIDPAPRRVGTTPDKVERVAYCPGSGADLAARAFALGAQVFLTGDLKFHQAQAVQELGLTLDVGHFCLEETMMRVWSEELAEDLAAFGMRVIFLPGRDPFA